MSLDPTEAERAPAPPAALKRWASRAGNLLVFTLSILVTLVIAEIGFRIVMEVPVFDATDWRADGARFNRIGDRAIIDPQLGWTLKPYYRGDGFTTLDHGFRRNGDETEIRQGSVLAVGDSFTEGFDEVDDAGTWPAQLEKIAGMPVVNAGVAGYATDQIILRAEQVLPIVKPKTLIVGFTEVDIYRSQLSKAGAPKPYFTVDDGELVFHAPGPLESGEREGLVGKWMRAVLGYSALGNYMFSRLTPSFWYPAEALLYEEIENEPIEITCKLLGRLKQQTDASQVRLILLLQYGGEIVLEEPVIVTDMRKITDCAQAAGIQVIDQFAPLKALTRSNPDLVALYYTLNDEEFGHMTPKGNEHAAQLLAAALKDQPAPPQSSALPEQSVLRN